jgi:hypothetical protein
MRLEGWARVDCRRLGCSGSTELEACCCCCSYTRCRVAADISRAFDIPCAVVVGAEPELGRVPNGVRNSTYVWNNARLMSYTRFVRVAYRASICGVGGLTVILDRITEIACSSLSRSRRRAVIVACACAQVVIGGTSSLRNSCRCLLCCSANLIAVRIRKACACRGWSGRLMSMPLWDAANRWSRCPGGAC